MSSPIQDIADKLTLLLDEVNSAGARSLDKSDHRTAEALLAVAKGLKAISEGLNSSTPKQHKPSTYPPPQTTIPSKAMPSVTTQAAPHSRAYKTGLLVKLSSGKVINARTAAETFALTLAEFGFEKVRALNRKIYGVPLIGSTKDNKYNQTKVGPVFVLTHSNTQNKKDELLEVADKLGIRVHVEVIN